MERIEVLVVGAGQAGLATSHELTGLGVVHVVLERGRIGETRKSSLLIGVGEDASIIARDIARRKNAP